MGLDDEKFPRKLRNRGEIVVQAVVTRGRRRSSSLGSKNLYRRALYFVISVSLNHGLTRRFSSRSITRYRGSIARVENCAITLLKRTLLSFVFFSFFFASVENKEGKTRILLSFDREENCWRMRDRVIFRAISAT